MAGDKKICSLARGLRNNPTDAERVLWSHLRCKQLGIRFRRQVPFGQYITDFASFEKRIIIEIDGGQHSGKGSDGIRDRWFQEEGFTVLRFWNSQIFENIEGVLEEIKKYC